VTADKLLLFVGAEWARVCTWTQGRLKAGELLSNDTMGHERFSLLMQEYRGMVCSVLTDLVEEDFRFEAIPHVRDRGHADIVGRKFEQFYRDTPLRHAQVQYRKQDGRRDDMMLFSALTNPSLVMPWLDILLFHQTIITGVYSVPLIGRLLVGQDIPSHLLLVTWGRYSGLREIYFRNGQISFSRLTPFVDEENITEKLRAELNRTYKYLGSFSLLPAGQPLDVRIVCSKSDGEILDETLKSSDKARYLIEDINQVAKRIGFDEACAGSDVTPLLLHLLGSRSLPNQYATPVHMHFHRLWSARRVIRFAAITMVLACVTWAGIGAWRVADIYHQTDAIHIRKETVINQYQAIVATFPNFPVPVDQMKAAVSLVQGLPSAALSPQRFLAGVSHELEQFPMIQVNSLSWQASASPEVDDEAVSGNQQSMAAATSPATQVAYQEIVLDGEIVSPQNIRSTIDLIHQFRHALQNAGYKAMLVVMPLDLDSAASIAGDLDDHTRSRNAGFVIRIMVSHPVVVQKL
jgi:hypothetical protein